ncbi:UNVERIFIED_CONTAM: hypothetical protein RMT77_014210 [Armadillidium vulgare]
MLKINLNLGGFLNSQIVRSVSNTSSLFHTPKITGNCSAVPSYKGNKLFIKTLQNQSENYCSSTQKTFDSEQTHFGYETVSKEEKTERVHSVFENVAEKYDLMNDVMSGGIHRLWKDYFVDRLHPTVNINLLDVAGGTGDITFRVLQYIRNEFGETSNYPVDESSKLLNYEKDIYSGDKVEEENRRKCKVTVCDLSDSMLSVGKERALTLGYDEDIDWICGNAQELPFPDDTFDAYTIAYGMRNVADIPKALSEAYRVLKPGGRFMCLEFSLVENSLIRSVYDLYSFQLIPVMGQIIAADWDSYQYLVESIRKFPDQETYKSMIEEAGFRNVLYENLTFGVTAIHSGFKI